MTLVDGVPIQTILFTVFQSIFEVFLLCLAGFVLSFRGIVDKSTSKALNHINVALFTPALLFSKVAYFLSPAKLRQLWVIPIFFAVLTGISALVAYSLARACRLKRSQVNFATAAAMFMNSNSLPVALMQSLAITVPLLKWDPDDTVDAIFGRSLTYLVVFSTLGMILRWSYGVRLLSLADEPDPPDGPAHPTYRDSDDTGEHPALVHISVDSPPTPQLVDYETETDDRSISLTRPLRSHLLYPHHRSLVRRHTLPYRYAHHSHLPAVPTSLVDQSESEDTDELEATEGESEDTIALPSEAIETGSSTEAEDTALASRPFSLVSNLEPEAQPQPDAHPVPRWGRRSRPFFKRLFTMVTSLSPPLVASILALVCVLVPPMQRLLNSNEMTPFKGALDNAGGCSISITLIVLGGWFWDGKAKPKGTNGRTEVRSVSKHKGKSVKKHHRRRDSITERQNLPPGTTHEHTMLRHKQYSRDSSAGSLIGTFGDALMTHIYPRGGEGRAKRREILLENQDDVEPGLSAIHMDSQQGHTAENSLGRASRSRSRSWANPVSTSPTSAPTGETNPPGETLTIVVTLLARMIIVPIILTPVMVLVGRHGWGGQVSEDPVFIVSSMLLISSPPALTLAQISQRASNGANAGAQADAETFSPFERLLSRTVFWAYCVLTPPVTIVSVMVGLLLVEA